LRGYRHCGLITASRSTDFQYLVKRQYDRLQQGPEIIMADSPEEKAHWKAVLKAFDGYMQYHVRCFIPIA
jgi:hypothetical protein